MDIFSLTGKCDRTRYPLPLDEGRKIFAVSYRDQTLPRTVKHTDTVYPVPENAQLNPVADPPDLKPDSLIAAYWFVRACYESFRRPAFYYYAPAQTLIMFPPVLNDGDTIIIQLTDPPTHEESNPS